MSVTTVKLGPFTIPPKVKAKLARRAVQKKTSLNDVSTSILAEALGIAYEPTTYKRGEKAREVTPFPKILLDVPPEVKNAVVAISRERNDSQRNVVVEILSEAVKVPFVPTARWRTSATAR